ncbi:MAG: hypothetical protein ACI33I_03485, partial [Clostridium sp.]
MALNDWNNDGKKDFKDDFIEYKIYEESMKGRKNDDRQKINYSKSRNKSQMSSFGSILSIVLGLVLTAILFIILDVNIDNVPVLVICFIW